MGRIDLLEPPIMTYKDIHLNNEKTYAYGDTVKASYKDSYNKLYLTLNSSNVTLRHFMIRVTKEDEEYGLEYGDIVYNNVDIINQNTDTTVSFNITSEVFDEESKYDEETKTYKPLYRIGLYAQSMLDYSWNTTYILLEYNQLQLSDSAGNILDCYSTLQL